MYSYKFHHQIRAILCLFTELFIHSTLMSTSFGWEGKGRYGSFRWRMNAGCSVQVKLWDPLRTRVIPERLRGVITTRRYTNPRSPLPLPLITAVFVYGHLSFVLHCQLTTTVTVWPRGWYWWRLRCETNTFWVPSGILEKIPHSPFPHSRATALHLTQKYHWLPDLLWHRSARCIKCSWDSMLL